MARWKGLPWEQRYKRTILAAMGVVCAIMCSCYCCLTLGMYSMASGCYFFGIMYIQARYVNFIQ
jgi:hypothetical protein